MKRTTPLILSALTTLTTLVALATPTLAQEPACQAQLEQRYGDASADLSLILEKLPLDKRSSVLGWADCEASHYNLGRVTEEAVRALDQTRRSEGAVTLFLSAAQTLQVANPKGAFPRSELVPHISSRPGRAILESRLQPPLGDLSWAATLADLNAETHSVQAWASLSRAGLLKEGAVTPARDELAGAMLMAATWLDHAMREQPPVFTALANDAAAVDAFGLLWTRAEAALKASQGMSLGKDDQAILKATYAKLPALKELFVRSGRRAPSFNEALAAAGGKAEAKDSASNKEPDPKPVADDAQAKQDAEDDAKPNKDEAAAQADDTEGSKETDPEPKDEAKEAASAKAKDTEGDTKATDDKTKDNGESKDGAKKDDEVEKDEAKKDETKKDEAEKDDDGATEAKDDASDAKEGDEKAGEEAEEQLMPWEGTVGTVRMVALALGLLLPWFLLLILFVRKRGEHAYVQLANQFVTFATVLLIVETIVVLLVSFMSSLDVFWTIDGVFLAIPPYTFVILMLMYRKLDPEGRITARRVVRNWAIGGSITLGVLVIGNIIVPFTVPQAFGVFALPITFVIIGLMACGFLLHLWMVSSRGEGEASEEEAKPEEAPDAPDSPKEEEPAPSPAPSPARSEPPAEEEPAVAPAGGDSKGEEMSDKDFEAAFAALGDSDVEPAAQEDEGKGEEATGYEGMSDEEFAALFGDE